MTSTEISGRVMPPSMTNVNAFQYAREQHHNFNATQKLNTDTHLQMGDFKVSATPQNANRQVVHTLMQQSQQQPSSSSRPQRMSSAQPANRMVSYNTTSNDFVNWQQEEQRYQLQQQMNSSNRQARPSSSKRPHQEQQIVQIDHYSGQNDQMQYSASKQQPSHEGQRRSQSQKRQPSTSTQDTNESKFSQLVCQVPQTVDPKQMLAQMQRQAYQGATNDSKATTATNEQNQTDDEAPEGAYLFGPQRRRDMGKKTLVLDLDETLVHSSFKPIDNPDIILPVEIEGSICNIFILVRPGVSQFLKRMDKHYELTVFTASLSKYAEPLCKILDPEGLCAYQLYREHCTFLNNAFVKDLTRLGRPMTDLMIVDNSPVAYMLQPENAIPILSWYDNPDDKELYRIATLLERLAYEDDVRKVIRKICINNEIDPRAEQIYLQSQKRDHSQKVQERHSAHNNKKGSNRYESADNRNKHVAIVNEQLKHRNGQDDSSQSDTMELMNQKQGAMRNNFMLRQSQDSLDQLLHLQQQRQKYDQQQEQMNIQIQNQNQHSSNRANSQSHKDRRQPDKSPNRGMQIISKEAASQPVTTKGQSSNRNVFFSSSYKGNEVSASQNATPISKRSTSVRQSQNTQNKDSHHRKERGHSAGHHQKQNSDHSASRKKNTYTNFLSNTQKLTREDQILVDRLSATNRGHSQLTANSGLQITNQSGVSPRPSTVGHHGQRQTSHSVRNSHNNFSASQRIPSTHLTNHQPSSHQNPHQNSAVHNHHTHNNGSSSSHHSKKNSSTNASSMLKQSLRDFQDMLKLTQSKLGKQTSTSTHHNKKGPYPQPNLHDEGSFLKKLSRHSELQQHSSVNQVGQPPQQYASRYTVNSPKYKENQNILNAHAIQNTGPVIITNSQNAVANSNIILQMNSSQSSKHQKRSSNPFQVTHMRHHQDQQDSSIEPSVDTNSSIQNYNKTQQIKVIHNINNNQLRQSQNFKHSREQTSNKFINSYLNSVSATPTAAKTLRSSLQKGREEPILKEFSKNFYNQAGYSTAAATHYQHK